VTEEVGEGMKPKECSFPAADDGIRCELLGLLVE